jgi:hypothetical protein
MQRAVTHRRGAREIDRTGELRDDRQDLVDRRWRVVAERDVQRFGGDVLFGAIRHRAFDARRNRFNDRRMEQSGISGRRQLVGERLRLLGCDVESEDLDRDETIAGGFVCPEDRPERANADLMQHPEGAEGWRWCERRRIVSGQFTELLEAGLKKCNTI